MLSLSVFLILLIYLDPLTSDGKPANFFLRLSPLAGLGASLASNEWIKDYWPALLLLVATVSMGRFFCGWLCPFGITLDLTDKLFKGWRGGSTASLRPSPSMGEGRVGVSPPPPTPSHQGRGN